MNIEEFLGRYNSKSTKWGYGATLKVFFNVVGVSPDSYFCLGRDYEGDVEKFFQYRLKKNCAPKTINSDLGCIKTFFTYNRVDLPSFIWKDMRRRMGGSRPRLQDVLPTTSDLKKILSHMNLRGRAFYLTLISSGMRIGEACEIRKNDIFFNEQPVRVIIRGDHTKTKNTRTAFISNEAKETIEEWLKVRSDYLSTVIKRFPGLIRDPNDKRIFPFTSSSARLMWNEALKDAGLEDWDESFPCLVECGYKGRRTMHPHSLRQFFRTNAGTVVNQEIAEALIGHEQGIVSVYARYQKGAEKELSKVYKEKIESKVSIFSDMEEIKKIREETQKQSEEIEQQRDSLSHMVSKNAVLEHKIGELMGESDRIGRLEGTLATILNIIQGNTPDVGLQKVIQDVDPKVEKAMQRDLASHVNDSA